MARYDIEDENGNVVFTVEGDEPPTAEDVEELLSGQPGSMPAPAGNTATPEAQRAGVEGWLNKENEAGPKSLFSPSTVFPAASAALAEIRPAIQEGLSADLSGGDASSALARVAGAPFKAAGGLVQDIAGGAFRLAGSLIPSKMTRGTVADPETGAPRTRTATESLQNPNASLTTGLDESLQASDLPDAVKAVGQMATGAAQGLGFGAAKGAAKGIAASATAGARQGAGKGLTTVADAMQNFRLGATTKDVLDGYSPRTLAKNGLNRQAVPDAYKTVQGKLEELTARARAIKQSSKEQINVSSILRELREDVEGKKFNFSSREAQDALAELEEVITREAIKNPGSVLKEAQRTFTPRRPVFMLSGEEIQEAAARGEIKFGTRGGKVVPEYTGPEVVPEGSWIRDEGTYFDLTDANILKTEVGKESAFQHLAGKVRGDKAASASEKVYNAFYAKLKAAVDPVGGKELQAINREFSELIPVQNVLTRAMTREELMQALGRTDMPTTKFGLIRAAMRATRTDRGAMINAAGEALQRGGAADAAAGLGGSIGTRAAEEALKYGKRGALAGSLRGLSQ